MQDRRKAILKEIDLNGYVRVSALSRLLGCTEVTIRRDLNTMEVEGLLKRTHGGAVRIGKNFVTENVRDLIYSNPGHKIYIARLAYNIVKEKDVLFLDDATTCLYLAREIKRNTAKCVNVITNSILLASELMQTEHVTLKVIGGDAVGNLSATVGKEAQEQIEGYQADKVFLGVNGVDFKEGITGIGHPQMEIKQAMLRHAKETYVLADSSKFGNVYLSHICGIRDVTAILTDKALDSAYKKEIQQYNYPVVWEKEETWTKKT